MSAASTSEGFLLCFWILEISELATGCDHGAADLRQLLRFERGEVLWDASEPGKKRQVSRSSRLGAQWNPIDFALSIVYRHADMQLLEGVTMANCFSNSDENMSHVISGNWDPGETAFAMLNQETPPDIPHVYFTIAADMVIQQVAEPVR